MCISEIIRQIKINNNTTFTNSQGHVLRYFRGRLIRIIKGEVHPYTLDINEEWESEFIPLYKIVERVKV